MLIEKTKNKREEIENVLSDLDMDEVAVFKSGDEAVIVFAVWSQGVRSYILLTNTARDIYIYQDLVEFLKEKDFGFVYCKPYEDLDIYY